MFKNVHMASSADKVRTSGLTGQEARKLVNEIMMIKLGLKINGVEESTHNIFQEASRELKVVAANLCSDNSLNRNTIEASLKGFVEKKTKEEENEEKEKQVLEFRRKEKEEWIAKAKKSFKEYRENNLRKIEDF